MSRTTERMGTKSDWRRSESPAYGVKARRNRNAAHNRALAEHDAANERRAAKIAATEEKAQTS